MKNIYLTLFFILSVTFNSISQNQLPRCGTDKYYNALMKQDDSSIRLIEEMKYHYKNWKLSKSSSTDKAIVIPVVFHIVHNGEAIGTPQNPSESKILEQLQILNDIYANKSGRSVDTKVKFCLAEQNINGVSTTGILRYYGYKDKFVMYRDFQNPPDDDDLFLKTFHKDNTLPSYKYLNIWVANIMEPGFEPGSLIDLLGYSTFPWELNYIRDGVVINYKVVGLQPTNSKYGMGKTLVHEVGHWAGLDHTFYNSNECVEEDDCSSQGDQVCDTPLTTIPARDAPEDYYGNDWNEYNCMYGLDCGFTTNPQNFVQNYMDYNFDACYTFFTQGQVDRMKDMLSWYRKNIYENDDPPVACSPGSTGDDGGGGYSGGSDDLSCGECYEPYLANPFDHSFADRSWKFSKFDLYINVENYDIKRNIINIYERTCNGFEKKAGFEHDYVNGYHTNDAWDATYNFETIKILNNNTFVAQFYQLNESDGIDRNNLLIFKKIDGVWSKVGEVHIKMSIYGFFGHNEEIYFTNRSGSRYMTIYKINPDNSSYNSISQELTNMYNFVGPVNSENLFFYFDDSGFEVMTLDTAPYYNFRKISESSHMDLTNYSPFRYKNYFGNFFPHYYRPFYNVSLKNDLFVCYFKYTLEDNPELDKTIIFKKNNNIWSVYQELFTKGDFNVINNEHISKFNTYSNNNRDTKLYILKDSGIKFETINLSHLTNGNNIDYLCTNKSTINYELNQIILDKVTLKLSDVIGSGSETNICALPDSHIIYGYDITLGSENCIVDFQNENKTFIAENQIVFKPGVKISSSNVTAKISSGLSGDCAFRGTCLSKSSKSNYRKEYVPSYADDNVNEYKTIKIYPNPNDGTFYINITKDISKIQLYNMMGQLITEKIPENNNKINVQHIKNGIYNLILYNKNGSKESTKIIINK